MFLLQFVTEKVLCKKAFQIQFDRSFATFQQDFLVNYNIHALYELLRFSRNLEINQFCFLCLFLVNRPSNLHISTLYIFDCRSLLSHVYALVQFLIYKFGSYKFKLIKNISVYLFNLRYWEDDLRFVQVLSFDVALML